MQNCSYASAMTSITYKILFITAILHNLCTLSVAAPIAPMQLVGVDGAVKSANVIGKYIASSPTIEEDTISVINVIDCTGQSSTGLVNAVYGTSFSNAAGISLQGVDSAAVLYSSFKDMISPKFCGGKAVDFGCSMPGSICVAIGGFDIDSYLQGYSQVFRRLLKKIHSSGEVKSRLSIVVDKTDCEDGEALSDAEYRAKIVTYLGMLWSEFPSPQRTIEDAVDLKVVGVDATSKVSIDQARAVLLSASAASLPVSDVANVLTAKWNSIPKSIKPVLSPMQREAVYQIEAAYTSGVSEADIAIGQWQTRVARGGVIGMFAERVQELINSATKDYNSKLRAGHISQLAVRERGERLMDLQNHILSAANRLFSQQVAILIISTTDDFRKALTRIVGRMDLTEEQRKEQEQNALRKSMLDFKTSTKDLEAPELGLTVDDEQISAVSTQLSNLLAEFPDTAFARLEEVRKIERQARSGKGSSGRRKFRTKPKGLMRVLGMSLSLVGFLRPPGYGNLQGFIGYATGLFGLPCDLLLGVQNDGDSPEIMGEDREHPILRLQPKINFDIDL